MEIAIAVFALVWVSLVVFGADSGTAAWVAIVLSAAIWLYRTLRRRSKPNYVRAKSQSGRTARAKGREHPTLDVFLGSVLDRRDVLVIDVETTGLNENAVVVEAAVYDTTGAQRFHSYFMPPKGVRFTRGASEVNGLTRQRLKELNASNFEKKWPELRELLEGADMVLAWNAEFDGRLLNQTTHKHKLDPDSIRIGDLLGAFRAGMPGGRHGLANIAERLKVKPIDPHTACGDVLTTLAVMRKASTKKGVSMPARIEPETEKQSAYIDDLCDYLDINRIDAEIAILRSEPRAELSKEEASQVISKLKSWRDADDADRTPRIVRKLQKY